MRRQNAPVCTFRYFITLLYRLTTAGSFTLKPGPASPTLLKVTSGNPLFVMIARRLRADNCEDVGRPNGRGK